MARAERAYKPYGRPRDGRADPDGPGAWKHDLHQSSSLADRLSSSSTSAGSSSRPSLLSRISGGQGKELLPSGKAGQTKLFGFGSQPLVNSANPNAGVELFPTNGGGVGAMRSAGGRNVPKGFQAQPGQRSLVQSGFNAALGLDERSRRERRQGQGSRELMRDAGKDSGRQGRGLFSSSPAGSGGVSILGAGKSTTVVRVANLAYGTTAEDVVSAFAPLPIQNATISSSSSASLVSVDLELSSMADANELINKYDGQIADGNRLSVSIVRQSLSDRMASSSFHRASGPSSSRPQTGTAATGSQGNRRQELLAGPNSGKMYSDTILQSNPNAFIQTLAEERAENERNRQRANAWSSNQSSRRDQPASRNGGSLAARLGGGGGYRGRNQAASGMMVD